MTLSARLRERAATINRQCADGDPKHSCNVEIDLLRDAATQLDQLTAENATLRGLVERAAALVSLARNGIDDVWAEEHEPTWVESVGTFLKDFAAYQAGAGT